MDPKASLVEILAELTQNVPTSRGRAWPSTSTLQQTMRGDMLARVEWNEALTERKLRSTVKVRPTRGCMIKTAADVALYRKVSRSL